MGLWSQIAWTSCLTLLTNKEGPSFSTLLTLGLLSHVCVTSTQIPASVGTQAEPQTFG